MNMKIEIKLKHTLEYEDKRLIVNKIKLIFFIK